MRRPWRAVSVPALNTWLAALLLAAVFVPMALARLADGDEGAYLFAAKLVTEGKHPYFDFSYPQMPLLPYLYGLWMKIVGVSWYGGRALSTIFAIALGLALHRHLARSTGHRQLASLGVALFAFSGLSFAWYPIVHSFVFPTLMLVLAVALLDSTLATWKYFLSGFCLGLGIDTRFYVVVALPTLAVEVVRRERGRAAGRQLGAMAAGLLLAVAPALYVFLLDPDRFIFNVLRHHALRSTAEGAIGEFGQKASAVMTLLTLGNAEGAISLQFTILFILSVGLIVSRLAAREPLPPSASIAILLLVVSVLPTPTYPQYMCMALPFLIVNAVLLVADVRTALTGYPVALERLRAALLVVVALYVLGSAVDLSRYVASGDVTPSGKADDWRIGTINAVASAIDEVTPPDDRLVMTWWPGYIVQSRQAILPRTENHFNLWYAAKLGSSEVQRYKYMTIEELIWHIRHHTARTVVLGNWVFGNDRAAYARLLDESGYVEVRRVGDARIYRWNGPASSTSPTRN